ncbi:unnamed protein product, partial [Chrysoparadoxa australica]
MDACAICDSEKEEALVPLPCGHSFHLSCILTWSSSQGRRGLPTACPTCRHELVQAQQEEQPGQPGGINFSDALLA